MTEKKRMQLLMGQLYTQMPIKVRKLIGRYGCAENVFGLTDAELQRESYLSAEDIRTLRDVIKIGFSEKIVEDMQRKNIKTVCMEDEEYPAAFRQLTDMPYLLYYKGKLPEEGIPGVGVVGARSCSDYGRRCAVYFGRELAKAGLTVISGMATGIDGITQEAALEAGGYSMGVLGCGVDVVYPAVNQKLYCHLCEQGGLISEYLPGTMAYPVNFPKRNRLISILSQLLLVIEAREKSGTQITVKYALEQGREVYAVPGRIEDCLSIGCNRMIREGAGVAGGIEDILYALKMDTAKQRNDGAGERQKSGEMPKTWQTGIRPLLWKLLNSKPMDTDEIYRKLGENSESLQELMIELMKMELEGLVLCQRGIYSIS